MKYVEAGPGLCFTFESCGIYILHQEEGMKTVCLPQHVRPHLIFLVCVYSADTLFMFCQ